jgi:hypothetical protein
VTVQHYNTLPAEFLKIIQDADNGTLLDDARDVAFMTEKNGNRIFHHLSAQAMIELGADDFRQFQDDLKALMNSKSENGKRIP